MRNFEEIKEDFINAYASLQGKVSFFKSVADSIVPVCLNPHMSKSETRDLFVENLTNHMDINKSDVEIELKKITELSKEMIALIGKDE